MSYQYGAPPGSMSATARGPHTGSAVPPSPRPMGTAEFDRMHARARAIQYAQSPGYQGYGVGAGRDIASPVQYPNSAGVVHSNESLPSIDPRRDFARSFAEAYGPQRSGRMGQMTSTDFNGQAIGDQRWQHGAHFATSPTTPQTAPQKSGYIIQPSPVRNSYTSRHGDVPTQIWNPNSPARWNYGQDALQQRPVQIVEVAPQVHRMMRTTTAPVPDLMIASPGRSSGHVAPKMTSAQNQSQRQMLSELPRYPSASHYTKSMSLDRRGILGHMTPQNGRYVPGGQKLSAEVAREGFASQDLTLTESGSRRRDSGVSMRPGHPAKGLFTLTPTIDQLRQHSIPSVSKKADNTESGHTPPYQRPVSVSPYPPSVKTLPGGDYPIQKSQQSVAGTPLSPRKTLPQTRTISLDTKEPQQFSTGRRTQQSNNPGSNTEVYKSQAPALRTHNSELRGRTMSSTVTDEANRKDQRGRSRSPHDRTRAYRSRTPNGRSEERLHKEAAHHKQQMSAMQSGSTPEATLKKTQEQRVQHISHAASSGTTPYKTGDISVSTSMEKALRAKDDRRKMPPPAITRPQNPSARLSKNFIDHQNTLHKIHKTQPGRITKQSSHLKPKPVTQEARVGSNQKTVDRPREVRKDPSHYYDAMNHGVNMRDVEERNVAFDICDHYASMTYRLGHLPSRNPETFQKIVESIEQDEPVDGAASNGRNEDQRRDIIDLTREPSNDCEVSNDRELRNNRQISNEPELRQSIYDMFSTSQLGESGSMSIAELEVIDLTGDTNTGDYPVRADQGLGESDAHGCIIDEDGMMRAPEPNWTEERLEVEWLLMHAEKHGVLEPAAFDVGEAS